MIRFACPGCSATFTVPDDRAGRAGQCPQCRSQFVIPSDIVPDDGTVGSQPPPLPVQPPPIPNPAAGSSTPPVEIKPCPGCQTRLTVEGAHVGGEVSCPSCATVFKAIRADVAPPPARRADRTAGGSLVRLGSGSERDEDDDRDRRRSRRDEDDRRERRRSDDEDDDRRSRRRGGCPNCGSDARPVFRSEISTGGWITFAVLLSVCAPLCWIGLLMKDEYRACGECGRRV